MCLVGSELNNVMLCNALLKGIVKRKRSRMVFDEVAQVCVSLCVWCVVCFYVCGVWYASMCVCSYV